MREKLRGQKECYITVAFRASGCDFIPTIATISLQNIQMCLHTNNPGKTEKKSGTEKGKGTSNGKDRTQDAIRLNLLQSLFSRQEDF